MVNNSTYFNQVRVLGSQNQDFYQKSNWLTSTEKVFTESVDIDVERVPYPYYRPIYNTGIIEELQNQIIKLREEITKLSEDIQKLKKGREQQIKRETEQRIIPINFFETDKLKLKKSFNVILEYSSKDNIYIVDCPEVNLYGEGRDEISAIEDFKVALEESYFNLKEDKDRLSPHLENEWKFLTDILEEK